MTDRSTRDWHTVINGSGVPSVATRLALKGYYIQHQTGTPKGSMEVYSRFDGKQHIGTFTIEEACEKLLDGAPMLPARTRFTVPDVTTQGPARSAPSRPAAPRSAPVGGARPIIWAHADKVWAEAGKPTNVSVVLELRKRMMVELEAQGIKKSTSSTALGDWMKNRLSAPQS